MPSIEPKIFDFISDVVQEVNDNADGIDGAMGSDSAAITFAETFFDQFFGFLGHNISGFSTVAKRRAVRFVEGVSADGRPDAEVRRVVVTFEEFCDLASDAQGNYNGSSVVYARAISLLERLLVAAKAWITQLPDDSARPALIERIQQAHAEIGDLL